MGSNIPIRKVPVFAVSPDQLAVYIGEGPSPSSLFKLDATQPSLPLVLEDSNVPVSGTNNLALSPDGTRIYLQSGQALATGTFTQVAKFHGGRSALSADGTKLLIADGEATAAGSIWRQEPGWQCFCSGCSSCNYPQIARQPRVIFARSDAVPKGLGYE